MKGFQEHGRQADQFYLSGYGFVPGRDPLHFNERRLRRIAAAVGLCLLLVLLWSAWHRRLCLRDFGGITGDLTGFFISTAELLTLAVSALGGLIL